MEPRGGGFSKRRIGHVCNSVFKTKFKPRLTLACCASYTSKEAELCTILHPGMNFTFVEACTSTGDAFHW